MGLSWSLGPNEGVKPLGARWERDEDKDYLLVFPLSSNYELGWYPTPSDLIVAVHEALKAKAAPEDGP